MIIIMIMMIMIVLMIVMFRWLIMSSRENVSWPRWNQWEIFSFQQFIFSVNHFNRIGQVSWIMLQRLWDFQLRLSLLRPFLHSTLDFSIADFFCTIAKTEEYFFLKEKNESSVIYPVVQLAYQWRHIWQGGITPIINIFIIVINDVWLFFQWPGRGIIIIIIIIIILRLGDCLTTKATGSGCHQVKSISIICIKMLTLWRLSWTHLLKKDFVGQCGDFSADKIVLEFDYKGCRIGLPPTKLIGILETERILIWWEQWLKWQFREPVLQRCKIYPIERTYFWIFLGPW